MNEFETVVCGRCAGSGKYGPTCVYGGKCFKCHGSGKLFTKKGSAAISFYWKLFGIAPEHVTVGDVVRETEVTVGVSGVSHARRRYRVETVSVEPTGAVTIELVAFKTGTGLTLHTTVGGSPITVLRPKEVVAEFLAIAKAFEGTLTKVGKPRVRKVRGPVKEAA